VCAWERRKSSGRRCVDARALLGRIQASVSFCCAPPLSSCVLISAQLCKTHSLSLHCPPGYPTQPNHPTPLHHQTSKPTKQAKLAKLRRELLDPTKGGGGGGGGDGFDVNKVGDARVGFVGAFMS